MTELSKNTKVPQCDKTAVSRSLFQIYHDWKHVQGHIATTKWNGIVEAENEEEAILKYKEKNTDLGQYIKKDLGQNYWFYGTRGLFSSKEENRVYAVRL